jgi:hypothetical protein
LCGIESCTATIQSNAVAELLWETNSANFHWCQMEMWKSEVLIFLLLNSDIYVCDTMSDRRWLHYCCDSTYRHKKKEKFVCVQTILLLCIDWHIFHWLSSKCVDADAKYYMCTYARKCFTFTLCSSSCPLVVRTCDGHLRMMCRWVNQERKKLTFLNLYSACESSLHGVHKKCVTNFIESWKVKETTQKVCIGGQY